MMSSEELFHSCSYLRTTAVDSVRHRVLTHGGNHFLSFVARLIIDRECLA